MKKHGKNLALIIIGSAITGFGINYFNIANGLAEGGVTGVTLLLKYIFNWDPGLVNLALNIPLLILGWRILGARSLIYTVIGTLALSLFLSLFSPFRLPLEDPLLAALYAGVTVGFGLGIVFRGGGTTGGSDIIARILNKYRGISMGRVILFIDVLVIGLSLLYLNLTGAMYTLVAVFIGSRVIDFVQEGAHSAKAVTIISDANQEIARKILEEMGRGVTLLNGKGGWTGDQKNILYCVINRREITRLKAITVDIDPTAFIIVNDAREVLGEGFTLDENKRPLQND